MRQPLRGPQRHRQSPSRPRTPTHRILGNQSPFSFGLYSPLSYRECVRGEWFPYGILGASPWGRRSRHEPPFNRAELVLVRDRYDEPALPQFRADVQDSARREPNCLGYASVERVRLLDIFFLEDVEDEFARLPRLRLVARRCN